MKGRVHLALFTVALLFSANYIVAKLGMREFSPLSFAWLRIAGAAAILAFIVRNRAPLAPADARRVALFALLGVVINATLFLVGLSLTTVQISAVLITTIPVFTLGAAIVAGSERPTVKRIAGIALAGTGALLVVGGESFHGTRESFIGAVMIVVNCLSYSLYLVISKPHMARLSAMAVVARMFLVGSVLMLPISAYALWREDWASISMNAWIALFVTIVGPTVIAYLLQAWALRHADSSVVAAYTYVQPVLAGILGAIVFGETLRPVVALAAALIFGGVWLASGAAGSQPAGTAAG